MSPPKLRTPGEHEIGNPAEGSEVLEHVVGGRSGYRVRDEENHECGEQLIACDPDVGIHDKRGHSRRFVGGSVDAVNKGRGRANQ